MKPQRSLPNRARASLRLRDQPVWWAVPTTAVGVVVASHAPTMSSRLGGVAAVVLAVLGLSWMQLRRNAI